MIGHLYTLLFVGQQAAPVEKKPGQYYGGGGHIDLDWRDHQIALQREEAENMEAIELIGAFVAAGVFQ